MKKISVLVIVLFYVGTLMAQTNFKYGYIIKLNGDTLRGEIDYRGDITMSQTCAFREHKNAEIKKYNPSEISSYRFTDGKFFVSKKVKDADIFLEYMVNGKVSVYYYRETQLKDHYFLEKDGKDLIELPYEKEIITIDDVKYAHESKKHMGILTLYMQDAPELASEIKKIKEPEHKNLIKLAEKYHAAVCDGQKCIIYEKKIPPIKVNLELVGGLTAINEKPFKTYTIGGVFGHIWLPRVSEDLYLKIGFILASDKNITGLYKIPLQLEYLYPKGIIRPRVAFGFSDLFVYPVASVGANIVLNKRFQIAITYDRDFYYEGNGMPFPNQFLSNSLYAGLSISL